MPRVNASHGFSVPPRSPSHVADVASTFGPLPFGSAASANTPAPGSADTPAPADAQEWVLMRVAGDPEQRVLVFDRHEWECFLDGARNGEFDDAAASP